MLITSRPPRRRLSHAGHAPDPLTAWLATVAPGTRGTAAELLPSFLASNPAHMAQRTPATLGYALARLETPRILRSGVSTWTLAPVPVVLPWH